jgi:plastocyanin
VRWRIAGLLIAAATVALLSLAPAGAGKSGMAGSTKAEKVWVHDNFFDRRSVEVPQEGKVVWVWKGMNRHNVRFTKVPPGASRRGSKTLYEGRWRRSFKVPGVYRYVCKLYAGMRGTVTVTPPPKGGAAGAGSTP